ncbi:MAG: hypothetical protein JXM79_23240 [Sedimentisphaerales bacterium]|nr:hypothetical protein [Sedimentisphaerales bacterium]
MYALAFAYDRRKDFFNQFDRDANGQADILDEAIWGATFLEKCLNPESLDMVATISSGYGYWGQPEEETDNRPGTGDERPVRDGMRDSSVCTRGFALLGKYVPHYLAITERLYEKRGGHMPELLALFSATKKDLYRNAAKKRAEALLQQGKDTTTGGCSSSECGEKMPMSSVKLEARRQHSVRVGVL